MWTNIMKTNYVIMHLNVYYYTQKRTLRGILFRTDNPNKMTLTINRKDVPES